MAEVPPRSRVDAGRFEEEAAAKVAELGLDLQTFAATFDLVRVTTRIVQFLEAAVHRPAGWSFAGFRVMFCVWVEGELEPRSIARLSGLSRAAVSSVLNTLQRDGLVERSRESDDRRLVTVRLTADGRRRLVRAYEAQNRLEAELLGALESGELRALTESLRELLAHPLPTRSFQS